MTGHGPHSINRVALTAVVCVAASSAGIAQRTDAGSGTVSESIAARVAESIAMVEVPSGTFTMGTPAEQGFQNGTPSHRLSVSSFRMSRTEISFDQYDAYARDAGRELPPDEAWGRDQRPVIHITWRDIHGFIEWLNAATGRRFRLPTEAEWEYAARGGTETLYWWGDDVDHGIVNNSVNVGGDRWEYTAPVGQLAANAYGLFDMLGNVWEFVQDCRFADYVGAPDDGRARLDGECDSRVARGGSWGSTSRGIQVAARAAAAESFQSMDLGFRLAESIEP